MPVFTYTSVCCGAAASKPACEKPKAAKKGKGKTQEYATLGTWSCDRCGKKCKVTRSGGTGAQS